MHGMQILGRHRSTITCKRPKCCLHLSLQIHRMRDLAQDQRKRLHCRESCINGYVRSHVQPGVSRSNSKPGVASGSAAAARFRNSTRSRQAYTSIDKHYRAICDASTFNPAANCTINYNGQSQTIPPGGRSQNPKTVPPCKRGTFYDFSNFARAQPRLLPPPRKLIGRRQ